MMKRNVAALFLLAAVLGIGFLTLGVIMSGLVSLPAEIAEENTGANEAVVYARTPAEYLPYGKFREPYKRFFLTPNEYRGYGRNLPVPEAEGTVKIGFLGPIERTVSVATGGVSSGEELGRKMLAGALLAVEQANERNGFRGEGVPFELVVRNDNGLWGASGEEVIDLAYREKVWAILGTIDGANSHIAIRAALKIEIPVMNTGDTDPTFIETAIPWVFRCITDDRQMCYLLSDYVFKKLGLTRVAALRANNRYGRIGIDEFRDAAVRMGYPFLAEVNYAPGDRDFSSQLKRLKALNPEAIVTYGDGAESALILKQMRAMGMDQWLIGSDRMVTREFAEAAGKGENRVVAAYPYDPTRDDPLSRRFKRDYEARFGEAPESFAAHAFDGMNMLITAVNRAGLNRALIRDELAAMKTFGGVTGKKEFDAIFNNVTPAVLATLESGSFRFRTRDEALK